jgi:hypothetical protein
MVKWFQADSVARAFTGLIIIWLFKFIAQCVAEMLCTWCSGILLQGLVSLDYKGLQPGMAAQPIGPNK